MNHGLDFPFYGEPLEMKFLFLTAIEDFEHITGEGYTDTGCYYNVNFGFKKGDTLLLGYGKTTRYDLPVIFSYIVNNEEVVVLDLPTHPVLLGSILSKSEIIREVSQEEYLKKKDSMELISIRLDDM